MRGTIHRWLAPSVALLAIAASAAGVRNGFTYDDRYVIELNPFAHDLSQWWRVFSTSYWPKDWGGDGYRPLTVLAFKFESTIGKVSPLPFHIANILLYAVASMLVFVLARRLLPVWAAWLTAALFAVHPVHVEAVGNIVGQSELLVAITILSAVVLYLRDRRAGDLRATTALSIAGLYLIACFSKEHGIVLPALLGAAELTIIDDRRPWLEKVARLRLFYLCLTALALAFIAVRTRVLSDHGIGGFAPFTPFSSLHITAFDRVLTALGVVPQWLRLFYWPARLSAEYGPPEIPIAQGLSIAQLPGLLILFATLAFAVVLRRRQSVISFGIAFACITLLPSSNFLLPAGIVLAERTLFLPSVGAMLVLGALAVSAREMLKARYARPALPRLAAQALLVLALAVGIWRSVDRTRVWSDNETLFRQMVLDSPDGYRAHYMLGAWSFEKNRMREGEAEYKTALRLFPYDPYLAYSLAERYRSAGFCKPAIPLYRWSRGLDPDFPFGRTALSGCLLETGDYVGARAMALEAIRVGAPVKVLRRLIVAADSARRHSANPTDASSVVLAGTGSKVRQTVQKAAP